MTPSSAEMLPKFLLPAVVGVVLLAAIATTSNSPPITSSKETPTATSTTTSSSTATTFGTSGAAAPTTNSSSAKEAPDAARDSATTTTSLLPLQPPSNVTSTTTSSFLPQQSQLHVANNATASGSGSADNSWPSDVAAPKPDPNAPKTVASDSTVSTVSNEELRVLGPPERTSAKTRPIAPELPAQSPGYIHFELNQEEMMPREAPRSDPNTATVNQVLSNLFPNGFSDIFRFSYASEPAETTAEEPKASPPPVEPSTIRPIYSLETSVSSEYRRETSPGHTEVVVEHLNRDAASDEFSDGSNVISHDELLRINRAAVDAPVLPSLLVPPEPEANGTRGAAPPLGHSKPIIIMNDDDSAEVEDASLDDNLIAESQHVGQNVFQRLPATGGEGGKPYRHKDSSNFRAARGQREEQQINVHIVHDNSLGAYGHRLPPVAPESSPSPSSVAIRDEPQSRALDHFQETAEKSFQQEQPAQEAPSRKFLKHFKPTLSAGGHGPVEKGGFHYEANAPPPPRTQHGDYAALFLKPAAQLQYQQRQQQRQQEQLHHQQLQEQLQQQEHHQQQQEVQQFRFRGEQTPLNAGQSSPPRHSPPQGESPSTGGDPKGSIQPQQLFYIQHIVEPTTAAPSYEAYPSQQSQPQALALQQTDQPQFHAAKGSELHTQIRDSEPRAAASEDQVFHQPSPPSDPQPHLFQPASSFAAQSSPPAEPSQHGASSKDVVFVTINTPAPQSTASPPRKATPERSPHDFVAEAAASASQTHTQHVPKPSQGYTFVEVQKSVNIHNKLITEKDGQRVEQDETFYPTQYAQDLSQKAQPSSFVAFSPKNYVSLAANPINVQHLEYEGARRQQQEAVAPPQVPAPQSYSYFEKSVEEKPQQQLKLQPHQYQEQAVHYQHIQLGGGQAQAQHFQEGHYNEPPAQQPQHPEPPQEAPQPQEHPQERPQEQLQEQHQEHAQEHPQEQPQEHRQDQPHYHQEQEQQAQHYPQPEVRYIEKIVPKPYPVKVDRIVDRPYPVTQIVEKPVPAPYPVKEVVEKIVDRPVEVEKVVERTVDKPYPVHVDHYIDRPYPVQEIVEKLIHVPYAVPEPVAVPVHYDHYIDRPYPVETIVEKRVPYPVEKIVEKVVEKHVPVEVERVVEKPVEKIVEKFIDRPVGIPIHVPVAVTVPMGHFHHHQQHHQPFPPTHLPQEHPNALGWPSDGGPGVPNIRTIPPKVLQNYYNRMLKKLMPQLKTLHGVTKAAASTAVPHKAAKLSHKHRDVRFDLRPPPPPSSHATTHHHHHLGPSWSQGARYIYNTLPSDMTATAASGPASGHLYEQQGAATDSEPYDEFQRWRNGHVIKRSPSFGRMLQLEYGFKPPLVPSLEIDDQGMPLKADE